MIPTKGDGGVGSGDGESAAAGAEAARNLVAFWVLGFINNIGYVVMIAGAQEIAAGGVGLVYACDILPALVVKLTGPYWFHYVSYHERTVLAALWMLASFAVVAYGTHSLGLQLVGVAFAGLQSGMMEASFLALAAFYNSRQCLTCWSSGTGLAGVGGYAWVAVLHLWLGLSFADTLRLAMIFPVLYILTFAWLLDTAHVPSPRRARGSYAAIPERPIEDPAAVVLVRRTMVDEMDDDDTDHRPWGSRTRVLGSESMDIRERLAFILTLGPYVFPLTVVYFAEYTMQTGVWSAIGFPVTSAAARAAFYAHAGLAYQAGVFVARSSGTLCRATRPTLYALAGLQVALLGAFAAAAAWHVGYYAPLLLGGCLLAGLLGGAVYVNAYTLLAHEVPAPRVELALGAASVGDTLGILVADAAGLVLQGCLFARNGIPGATLPMTQCVPG